MKLDGEPNTLPSIDSVVSTNGFGVSIDNSCLNKEDENELIWFLDDLGGIRVHELEHRYQYNFIIYRFSSVEEAAAIVEILDHMDKNLQSSTMNITEAFNDDKQIP